MRNSVIPSVRYRHAHQAITWLCDVLGFEKQAVYEGPNGTVEHAQLTLEGGMIMLGSMRENEFSKYLVQPDEVGGRETRSDYLVINDVKSIYERAKAAGAEILLELRAESYGGEHFTCRDPEGHIWSVGSYDPWQK